MIWDGLHHDFLGSVTLCKRQGSLCKLGLVSRAKERDASGPRVQADGLGECVVERIGNQKDKSGCKWFKPMISIPW